MRPSLAIPEAGDPESPCCQVRAHRRPSSLCPHRVEGSLTGTLICSRGVRSHILSTCEGPAASYHPTGVGVNGGSWRWGTANTSRLHSCPRRVTVCGEEWAEGAPRWLGLKIFARFSAGGGGGEEACKVPPLPCDAPWGARPTQSSRLRTSRRLGLAVDFLISSRNDSDQRSAQRTIGYWDLASTKEFRARGWNE